MAERSFKSVGKLKSNYQASQKISQRPIGIVTPLRLASKRQGPFEMHYSAADQINDNLRNLILTNNGERLGRYNFGANIKNLVFELTSKEDFEEEAMLRIKDAVDKTLPVVELETFESDFMSIDNDNVSNGLGRIILKIKYNIPRIRIVGRTLEVILYVGG